MNVQTTETTAMTMLLALTKLVHSRVLAMQATQETVPIVPTLMSAEITEITAMTMLPALTQMVLSCAPVT
jgi:hypothetical protein